MDKVTRQCPQTTTFLKRKESRSSIEPRSLPLGQTGSLEGVPLMEFMYLVFTCMLGESYRRRVFFFVFFFKFTVALRPQNP